MTRTVLIALFDDVDTLDFCGPLEVFAITGQRATGPVPFAVTTVAERVNPAITTRSGLRVIPYYTFANAPQADLLVVPGGVGARHELRNPAVINFIKRQVIEAELVISICTGALILGAAGVLKGLQATTHHTALDELAQLAPDCQVVGDRRYVDNGQVITSAGITAGIDTALYVVQRLFGATVALETAAHMEYNWSPAEKSPDIPEK
ncbi:MAG: DJ-1/PfpI family protein [Chloroflexi bacterium]|nr:DJ-1/PfpI family protein [Chloroflexota bacterium]